MILLLCLSVPFVATWYMLGFISEDVFFAQKKDNLVALAKALNTRLGAGGYDEILAARGAKDLPREEKIAVLNEALKKDTDEIVSVAPGLGAGFYSRELDAILTYGPSGDFTHIIGVSVAKDHPGREVMAQNREIAQTGSMVRGNIMNAMIPVVRENKVIGYIWVNELVSDLEMMLRGSLRNVTFVLVLVYFSMIGIIAFFFRKIIGQERQSLAAVEQAAAETKRMDELIHMVNQAVALLLTAEDKAFEQSLQKCMSMTADAFSVDNICIWQRRASGSFERTARLLEEDTSVFDVQRGFMPDLLKRLQTSKRTQFLLNVQPAAGIRCATFVPVFLHESFWGVVVFSNNHSERKFTKDEEDILLSGSLLMANAVARNEMIKTLITAREEAVSGTKAKSAFLASMSHEMRTPMNAIIGMAAIGKAAPDTERKDYSFGKIEDASHHLLGVINDVLDISKIESGKLELSMVEFNFEKMLAQVVNVVSYRMEEREQVFIINIDKNVPQRLIGDDQRLCQVITNLLSNAVKFTPHNGLIRLFARLIEEKAGVCVIQIEVTDNGIGVDEEQQKNIFNAFEQAENSTTRKYGGTGLGLSISKSIVQLMGGHIWIQSEAGKGSTFAFTIKARRGAADKPLSPGWGALRFCVMDDDPSAREYFTNIAERFAVSCKTAEDAGRSRELLKTGEVFDVCFLSWKLPDSLKLAREIKARHPDCYIVLIIPAAQWDKIAEDAKAAGISEFLSKPLLPSNILKCVNRLFGLNKRKDTPVEREADDNFAGRRILLAEDVEINREIVLSLLEPTGLLIDCAQNGLEAVQLFEQTWIKYDMILMDVHMPEMDGYEATRRIRALHNGDVIPIVAMTANVFKEDVEKCLAAGMNDHIGKPLDIKEVRKKLRYYLTRTDK